MRLFLTPFLVLSSVLISLSCSPLNGYHRAKSDNSASLSKSAIIDSTVSKSVYKAKINIYDNYFSGLFLIKYMPSDHSYRIIFLSEVGLNLLDMKYQNDAFTVVSCQEFLNKKMVLKTFQNDFQLLFLKTDAARKNKIYHKKSDETMATSFRHNWDKNYYFWRGQSDYFRIVNKGFFNGSVNVFIHYNQRFEIDEMNFKHKGIKLEMNLLRLNKDE